MRAIIHAGLDTAVAGSADVTEVTCNRPMATLGNTPPLSGIFIGSQGSHPREHPPPIRHFNWLPGGYRNQQHTNIVSSDF